VIGLGQRLSIMMVTMAVMHEEVHQRTGEENEIGESTQRMSAMLSEHQRADQSKEAKHYEASARGEEAPMFTIFWVLLFRHRYCLRFVFVCIPSYLSDLSQPGRQPSWASLKTASTALQQAIVHPGLCNFCVITSISFAVT
jgi:hypothetical protein